LSGVPLLFDHGLAHLALKGMPQKHADDASPFLSIQAVSTNLQALTVGVKAFDHLVAHPVG